VGKSKLVRDKIPEMFNFANIRVANDEEYRRFLLEKLQEEVDEFKQDLNIEELADILEVVHAISKHKGTSIRDLEELRIKKAEIRGSFDKRIIWEGNERITNTR